MAPRTGPRRKHKRARADKPGKQIRKLVAMLNRGVLATAGLNHQEYTSELTLISREVEEAKAAQASPDSSVQKQCSELNRWGAL